jgi:3-oxoadipate enol-lactonase
MPLLKKDDGHIYYNVQGQGAPIVLLRGLGRSSRYWLGFDRTLAKHFTVITLDARGLGRTSIKASWLNAIKENADDVVSILDHLEIESAHIFGLSLGGMVAFHLCQHHRSRVESAIVANTSTADYMGLRINPLAIARLISPLSSETFQKRLVNVLVGKELSETKKIETSKRWQKIIEKEGFPLTTIGKQLLSASRFKIGKSGTLPFIPVAILYGEDDLFVPKHNSLKLDKVISQARAYRIEKAGHEITVGNQKVLIETIVSFVENQRLDKKIHAMPF